MLFDKSSYDDFSELFAVVHQRLRARGVSGGGEEMLRLRVYEKLQALVARGLVKKAGKTYSANLKLLEIHVRKLEETKAKAEERRKALTQTS